MWSIVNTSEEDRATDVGNVHKQFGKDSACVFGDILADRQTDPQTDILITILRNRSRGRRTVNITLMQCLPYKKTADELT